MIYPIPQLVMADLSLQTQNLKRNHTVAYALGCMVSPVDFSLHRTLDKSLKVLLTNSLAHCVSGRKIPLTVGLKLDSRGWLFSRIVLEAESSVCNQTGYSKTPVLAVLPTQLEFQFFTQQETKSILFLNPLSWFESKQCMKFSPY